MRVKSGIRTHVVLFCRQAPHLSATSTFCFSVSIGSSRSRSSASSRELGPRGRRILSTTIISMSMRRYARSLFFMTLSIYTVPPFSYDLNSRAFQTRAFTRLAWVA